MKRFAYVLIAPVFLLTGCAQHTWAPGPGAMGKDGSTTIGQCKLTAIGAPTSDGFVAASGSPRFVAASVGAVTIANAIGNAARQQNIFNACMEANGFIVADGQAQQNQTTQANLAKIQPVIQQSAACASAVYTDPQAEPLRRHIPLNPIQATAGQISDSMVATPEEIGVINALYPRMQACQRQTLAQLSAFPSVASIVSTSQAMTEGYVSAVRERRMTWGEFNRLRQEQAVSRVRQIQVELGRN